MRILSLRLPAPFGGAEAGTRGDLRRILRTSQWYPCPSVPHTLYQGFSKVTYSKGSGHPHAYQPWALVDVQGIGYPTQVSDHLDGGTNSSEARVRLD